MREVDKQVLQDNNETVMKSVYALVQSLQNRSLKLANHRIGAYVAWPALAVQLNFDAADRGAWPADFVCGSFKILWKEIAERFPLVDYLYIGDSRGTFVGYERLPEEWCREHGLPHGFGAEYLPPPRPPGQPEAAKACPAFSPPQDELTPGQKVYYIVDKQNATFVREYKSKKYDPHIRPWWKNAVAAHGDVAWFGPYAHTSGHTLGMTASKAYPRTGPTQIVFAADFTISYICDFLREITPDKRMRTFVVNVSGVLVASSGGVDEVITNASGTPALHGVEDLHGVEELSKPLFRMPMEYLMKKYRSLERLNGSGGTSVSDCGTYVFSYRTLHRTGSTTGGLAQWIIVSCAPVQIYSKDILKEVNHGHKKNLQKFNDQLSDVQVHSLLVLLLTLLGTAFITYIARSVTRPLKHISMDMLSLSKLEFVESLQGGSGITTGPSGRRRAKDCFRRSGSDSNQSDSSSDEATSDESNDGSVKCSSCPTALASIEPGLSIHIREIDNMRRAFAFMVNGLQSFAKYMDPNVVNLLVQSQQQAQLGVAKAEVSVFFSDIANFTTMAETMEPEMFMQLLGDYLEEMSRIILEGQGVVGEFIGDAIMAWWNVPLDLGPEHTKLALRCALAQQRRIQELQETWTSQGYPLVRARMGIVRGHVLAGNIGSSRRMKYGLVGDSVNLASRLEGLCKHYSVSVIIDDSARHAPGVEACFFCRVLDLVTVKGRSGTTELFELVASKETLRQDEAELHRRFVDDFRDVHRLYRAKAFRDALTALEAYLDTWPDDAPANMMRARCEALVAEPPAEDWTPVNKLTHK